jgi:hypothetical protein
MDRAARLIGFDGRQTVIVVFGTAGAGACRVQGLMELLAAGDDRPGPAFLAADMKHWVIPSRELMFFIGRAFLARAGEETALEKLTALAVPRRQLSHGTHQ